MVLKYLRSARTLTPLLLIAGLLMLPAAAQAATIVVPPTGSTTSIQNAVNAASPGDTIFVSNGTYSGPTVNVEKNNITISGGSGAVINAAGHRYALTVGHQNPDGSLNPDPSCGTPSPIYQVRNFTQSGMTIRNADDTGIFLMGVDRFRVTGGRYQDNREYGIFPRCSRDGLIDHNSGGGGNDATIYVGVDENIRVEDNFLTNGELAIELENTHNSFVRRNITTGNTVGIFAIVLPGLPTSENSLALIENNIVSNNNRPNAFPPVCDARNLPGCGPFQDDLQLLPSGSGILVVGAHDYTVRANVVTGNNTVGVGAAADPITGDSTLRMTVTKNVVLHNGTAPDPRTQGAGDLLFLDDPTNGSCFTNNIHQTEGYPFGAPLC